VDARRSPTLLVFEDRHWADEAPSTSCGFWADRIDPTAMLAIYRDDEVGPEHPLRVESATP
jgi:hypothetical protein